MPLYGFQPQFGPMILNHRKRHTIRPRRKRPTRPGDTLYLYTGLRTKNCKFISEETCEAVDPIVIDPEEKMITLNGVQLIGPEKKEFIYRDGFDEQEDFFSFFTRYPDEVLEHDLECIYWILP